MTAELEGLGVDVPDMDAPAGGEAPAAGVDAAQAPAGGGGSAAALAGSCGKFKEKGLAVPAGTSVMVCREGGGNDSIVLSGGGTPADMCKAVKTWAEGVGYTTEFDTNAAGTYAVTMKGAGDRLTVGCVEMAGQSTTSISLSPQ